MPEYKMMSMCLIKKDNIINAIMQPVWISVAEALPEVDQKVLIYAVGKAYGFEGDTVMALACQHMHRNGSRRWSTPWQYFHSDYKITHWMPLPDAPEVDDE